MDKDQDIWILIAQCAFNEASEEKRQLLQQLLQNDPNLQQQYDWLLQLLNTNTSDTDYETPEAHAINKILTRAALLESENQLKKTSRMKLQIWTVAASVIILIVSGYFLFFFEKRQKPVLALQPLISKSQVIREASLLPDGSKVWLNAGSKLFFENDFSGTTREVKLVGEAFFEVVKDTLRPFIVHVNEININVLGTSFNVKGYEEDKEIETTLYHGLVKVTKNNDDHFQPIMLHPNQKMVIPKAILNYKGQQPIVDNANAITLLTVDSTISEELRLETAWRYGRIDFKGQTLEQVANKMAYRYQVKFIFTDESVKQLSFTGSFKNESLEAALKALQTANPFNYKINAHEVIISSAK